MVKFPCTECGACCRRVGTTAQGLLPTKEDGETCLYLEGNLCSIYENRPDICNLSVMYDKHKLSGLLPKSASKRDYYKLAAKLCNVFIEEDDLDDKYKMDVDSI